MSEACLWRISQFEDLSGIGGTMVPGRWHHKGRPIVYLGDSPALCLLEILVHLEASADELPEAFSLLRASLPARGDIVGSCVWRAEGRVAYPAD
ncbi:RES family NAD+ phosphorylase [Halomonas mongoliensis]|uniref:RES family NAD+ phosphorylase n=1 Tax=Halomonas mongoliensis TaxID=321265 RepID=UPI00403B02B0